MGKGMAPSAPITEVWVKRSSNSFTKTVRYRKPVSEFVAELGGHLGLWVGASILTVIEIGEFLIHLMVEGWERKTSIKGKVIGEVDAELGEMTGEHIDSDMVEVTISERRRNVDSSARKTDLTGYGPSRRASKSYPDLMNLMESPMRFSQDETKEVLTENVYSMGSLDYQLTRKNFTTPVLVAKLSGSKTITKTTEQDVWAKRTRSYFLCDRERSVNYHGHSV